MGSHSIRVTSQEQLGINFIVLLAMLALKKWLLLHRTDTQLSIDFSQIDLDLL